MPQVSHHLHLHPHGADDMMMKSTCTVTEPSPGLTSRPWLVEMKPIRVSTCLCHFHEICICKRPSPIAARLCSGGTRIGRRGATAEPMGAAARRGPALPDTFRWEKQHGRAPLAVCPGRCARSLTRRTSRTSAAPRGRRVLQDLPLNKGTSRSILRGRSVMVSTS
ncbi:unnamed protein product [Pleuronectes platessa]|uniref:Uncharacterized protein n=1 Tax=Pleuronectes platessa TaxID=8262 RepID=A0A9N7VDX3_PLEPL|nr:unnamed protein product [Pleuronectes platessa]